MVKYNPLGISMALATKRYLGAFAKRLEHLEIERYYSLVLYLGDLQQPKTQQDLAKEFLKDKTVIVRIIDYLAEKNYVQRVVNPNDRREQHIMLTEYGKSKLPDIQSAILDVNKKAMQGLSEDQFKTFYEHLCLINENLTSEPALDIDFNCSK